MKADVCVVVGTQARRPYPCGWESNNNARLLGPSRRRVANATISIPVYLNNFGVRKTAFASY